jgi:sulfoxide reductase heme-binding subunit YedZ
MVRRFFPWLDRSGKVSPLKAAVFALLFVPGLILAWRLATNALGPRPVTEAIHETGDWAIRWLLISLAITPLRRITGWNRLILVRRMVGLAALGYALVHLLLYTVDLDFAFGKVASEIALRFYLTIGFVALSGLAILGVTSTDAMIRRLGRKWNSLHRIVYLLAVLGVVHFFIQSKADVYEPTLMAGALLALLLYRLANARGFDIASPPVLAAIAVLAALLTAGTEYLWYAVATGIPPMRVLLANLQFSFSIRPAWWVLAGGLGAALVALLRPFWGGRPPSRARESRVAVPAGR